MTRQPHGKPDTKPAWHQVCQGLGAEIGCSEILGASFLGGYVESPHRNPETIHFGDLFRASILENSPVSGKGWSWFQKHGSAPWLQSLQSPKLPISSNGTWAQFFDQLCPRTFLLQYVRLKYSGLDNTHKHLYRQYISLLCTHLSVSTSQSLHILHNRKCQGIQ